MADKFAGKWEQVEQTNFEEYMKEAGVGLISRKAAANLKVTCIVTVEGNTITWRQESTLKNHEMKFTLGEEFDETTPDGRNFKATITFDGEKLVQHQKAIKNGDKVSTLTRWVDGDKLHIKMECGSVVAERVYQKVN